MSLAGCYVIKRNGQEVLFDGEKISTAIRKANAEVDEIHMLSEYQIRAVTDRISRKAREKIGSTL